MKTTNKTWDEFTERINKELEYFSPLECPSVKYMMVFQHDIPAEKQAYKLMGLTDYKPLSLTNAQHCAYHLYRWKQTTGKSIKDIEEVFEYGAGYGEMAKIIKYLNPNVKYLIYDLPVLRTAQEEYLKGLDVIFTDDFGYRTLYKKGLFIATWSLTESHIDVVKKVLNLDCINPESESILIAAAIDKRAREAYTDHKESCDYLIANWNGNKPEAIEHLQGHRYFFK